MRTPIAKTLVVMCTMLILVSAVLAAALVDLNTASQKDLEALKGVGPATAKKIIAGRPYSSADGLSKAGLSAKLIADLKPLVTVSAPAAAPTSAAAPSVSKAAPKSAPAPAGLVDLNTSSQKDLEALKGVGPATAKKIIAGRPYASVDGLTKAGLSAKLIADLKPLVTVSAQSAATASKVVAVPAPAPAPAPVPASKATPAPAPASTAAPVPAPAPKSTSSTSASAKLASGQTVNINTASKEQLDALPGIGPVKAQAIIDGRPYAKIEDIMKVKGIKQATFDKIKSMITVQ